MALDEARIEQIVEMVVQQFQQKEDNNNGPIADGVCSIPTGAAVADGVFQDMDACIDAATAAQKQLVALPLAVREDIIAAIRKTGIERAETYGQMEFDETGLGKATDNVQKNLAACRVMGMEDLDPEVFSGDKGVTIIERIPVGLIASVNPVTNGTPSILFNAIMMLAGGNTVVNNPHPKTSKAACQVVRDLNKAIVDAGGPPNCICCLETPTVPSAQALMTDPRVKLIAVTGGHGVMAFASQTGKRIIAGGPGNPPVVVDDTADLDRAARCIVQGASFSNCMACASEKEIFVVDSVADPFKAYLQKYGAFEMSPSQGDKLLEHIFSEIKEPGEPGVINMDYIGRSPSEILKAIGLDISSDATIAFVETDKDHPLVWTEQIMPILPLVRCKTADEAIDAALAAEQGNGHTMAIHSNCMKNIQKMTNRAKCAAFVKNGSCGLASVGVAGEGYTSFHIATNGEGQTRPRMFTLIRRCVMTNDLRFRYGG